ncbi:MAG: trigger factor [candidate division Zixibacteria bacterium]|nr:trigger factor [candidate division Zixibacteria bacterium]
MVMVKVENGEGLTRKVSVEVPAETFQTEMEKKLDELRQGITLKGFRKGKAPLEMVRSQYGDQVKADVVDELFRKSLSSAIDDHKLNLAGRPKVTALDLADDGKLSYEAELEVFPEIARVEYDGLALQGEELTVADSDVDEIVQHYRKHHSQLRPLDRAALDGDVVVVDLIKIADPNKTLPTDSFPDSQIDLGSAATIKEFKELLPGMKAGDEKQVEVVYEKDYSDPVFAGAHITYNCKVKSVNERILPEVNDVFAKQTGLGETALEFRLKIRERLLAEKQSVQRRMHRREIVELVCNRNDVPIPESPINEYLDNVVKDFKEQGEPFDEKELRERYRPVGVKSMRWDLLWRRLAEQEKIEVLPDDTENWIKGFATYHNVSVDQAKESLRKAGKLRELRDSILEEKAIDFLLSKAIIAPAVK